MPSSWSPLATSLLENSGFPRETTTTRAMTEKSVRSSLGALEVRRPGAICLDCRSISSEKEI